MLVSLALIKCVVQCLPDSTQDTSLVQNFKASSLIRTNLEASKKFSSPTFSEQDRLEKRVFLHIGKSEKLSL